MNKIVGVDLGGTNVRAVLVNEKYEIIREKTIQTGIEKGIDYVKDNIIELIAEVVAGEKISGIGIGAPGPVDEETRTMIMATNLVGFENYPLAKHIEDKFGVPTYLGNDANVAGLAEALIGGGKGSRIVWYVTVSTGIGGGLVIDGKVINGNRGYTGEIGNVVVRRDSTVTFNGLTRGAVEGEASGSGIVLKGKELFGDKIENAGDVVKLAVEGNNDAIKLLDEAIDDLAILFATLAQTTAPDVIVVGGGVMKSSDYILPKLEEKFNNYIHSTFRGHIKIELAKLEQCGAIGAAMLAESFLK